MDIFFVRQYNVVDKSGVLKPFLDTKFSIMKVIRIVKLQNYSEAPYKIIHMNLLLYSKFLNSYNRFV